MFFAFRLRSNASPVAGSCQRDFMLRSKQLSEKKIVLYKIERKRQIQGTRYVQQDVTVAAITHVLLLYHQKTFTE